MAASTWVLTAALPDPWHQARWRRVDPDRDADLVHGWMQLPHVAPYWQLELPPDRIAGYLAALESDEHSEGMISEVDGGPAGYWEIYWAHRDRLAEYCRTEPADQGVHLLLGPPELIGRGLGSRLLESICGWMFARDRSTMRLMAEPDVRNLRSVAAFRRCGFEAEAELELPEKRAVLMVRHR